jgi:hypothetical protein
VEATVSDAELCREYLDAFRRRTTIKDTVELIACGVPVRAITLVCPVPMNIVLDATGELYQPDPSGKPAWVLPVCTTNLAYPAEWIETAYFEDIVSHGPILDLIAFSPTKPGRWALRLGEVPVLGAIEPQYLEPDPVPVHRDVTDWLRAGCRGIMLLTRDPCEAGRILRWCRTVEAEDAAHAAELLRLINLPPYVDTTVSVRRALRTAA